MKKYEELDGRMIKNRNDFFEKNKNNLGAKFAIDNFGLLVWVQGRLCLSCRFLHGFEQLFGLLNG